MKARGRVGFIDRQNIKIFRRCVTDIWDVPGFSEINLVPLKPHLSRIGAYRYWLRQDYDYIYSDWWIDMEQAAIEQEKYYDNKRDYHQ